MGQNKKKIQKEQIEGELPETISMATFPDELIEKLAVELNITNFIEDIHYDEFRMGLIRELDNMEVYTMRNLTHEKLTKAALKACEALIQNPGFYSNPPAGQEAGSAVGNPLISQQGELGQGIAKRNPLTTRNEHRIERMVEQIMLEEGLQDLLRGVKTASAKAWAKTKGALQKASQGATGAINAKVSRVRELRGSLESIKNMVFEAEKESREKLPISKDMEIAMKIPSLAKQAVSEINTEKQAVSQIAPAVTQQAEIYTKHVTNILNEIKKTSTNKRQPLNEEATITLTSIIGLVMAVLGGVPLILKGLYKLSKKLGFEKTSIAIHHVWHVVHKVEEKTIDYVVPDKLSYVLYNKAWKKGFKTSKAHLEFEQYKANQGGARKKVENLIYKIMLVYFLFAGFEVVLEAGASMIGVAKGAANMVKAIEIAGGVIEAGEIIAPAVMAGRVVTA